ncbi:hypothetical protein [Mucilaginibacter sp. CSA2-8R]|uniref:hypothetical protein n=1 Tax=Mucilaginibacter sp. CSA2-8R TaxID=3141542 RepID=UPI00315CE925
MGHVVDIFKVDPQLIRQRINDVMDNNLYPFTFKQFVDRNNSNDRSSQSKLDAEEILHKIRTDIYQLNADELMELLFWLKEVASEEHKDDFAFEVPAVEAHMARYGFIYVERINDRSHSFSFTWGDFLFYYHNDFDDEFENQARETFCLNAEEFNTFISYGRHLFAKILLKENCDAYSGDEEIVSISKSAITDKKLEAIVDDALTNITKIEESESTDTCENPSEKIYARYYCNLGEFEYLFYRFQSLWEEYKDNRMSVILL